MTKEKLKRANELEEIMEFAEWMNQYPKALEISLSVKNPNFDNTFGLLTKVLGEEWYNDFMREIDSRINKRIVQRFNELMTEFDNL